MAKPEFVLNLAPQHSFAALAEWPEAQLLLLAPRAIWERTRLYVSQVEAVALAGRFGADPGEYEWEVLEQPPALKWLPRTPKGDAAYFGFAVTANAAADPLEIYGMIDVGSDSPWWYDAVDDMSPLLHQSDSVARSRGLDLETVRLQMSLDEFRRRELITAEPAPGEAAWRIGIQAEVKRFKDALIGLFERARKADPNSTPAK